MELNSLKAGMQPAPGEKLYLQENAAAMPKLITSSSNVAMHAAKQQVEAATDNYTLHTVQSKETLYAISKKYSVSVEDIMEWNGMESRELKSGQQLRINTKINVNNQGTR
jgi:LysM repeat protein